MAPERDAEMLRLLRSGRTAKSVAEQFGICVDRVRQVTKREIAREKEQQ